MASNFSGKFVGVRPKGSSGAFTYFPTPSTYKMTSSTFVDSARSSEGKVVGSVIRSGVRQIAMSWNFLTQAQFTLVASFFEPKENFYFDCEYYDTITGQMEIKTMYVSDRVSDNAHIKVETDNNGNITNVKGYESVSLTLVEVQYVKTTKQF